MIPREILKKIRQIELRTNRIVTESRRTGVAPVSIFPLRLKRLVCEDECARFLYKSFSSEVRDRRDAYPTTLFQPPAQFLRIPRSMPDGADNHLGSLAFDNEEYGIRPWFWHFGLLGQPAGEGKSFRVLANRFEKSLQVLGESLADTRLAFVVEVDGVGKFQFRFLLNEDSKTHRLARNRFSMSATTSSSGRQSSGCASARSARRSSSAICSGVSSSSNFSRSCSKTSRCSSNGSRSSCSKTWAWAALMALIYSVDLFAQAGVSTGLNSAIGNRQPAISP
jgi:hypothetical protein